MTDLHVRSWGDPDAPTVLLVHAGVADSRGWTTVATQLAAAGYHCVAPDLRGFGQSPDAVTDFRHVDDLLAVLDSVDARTPAVVVGWSFGGGLCLELALEHASRVRALGLVCSVPLDFPRSPFVQDAWEREEELLRAGDVDGAIRNDVATWGAGPTRGTDSLDHELIAYMEDVGRDLVARQDLQLGEPRDGDIGASSRFGEVTSPLLLVVAELDTTCHEDAASLIATQVPDARVEHVAGAAHMAPLERPDAVADLLLDWLASLD